MDFSKIISVGGKPGLFQILSQTKKGVIAQSLIDGRRIPIKATHNISLLENIAIYTYETEVPLSEVFFSLAQKEEGCKSISHKVKDQELISYFSKILPNYDNERVYTSNIKKVIQWYNILVDNKFDFSSLKETSKEKK